jgi:hypothetical protein
MAADGRRIRDAKHVHKEDCASQILDARIYSSVSDRKIALVTGTRNGTDGKFRGFGLTGRMTSAALFVEKLAKGQAQNMFGHWERGIYGFV